MARHGVSPLTRERVALLATATELDPASIAGVLDLQPRTVERIVARDGCRRPEPDLAALVGRIRDGPASPEARWDALVACLWGLSSHENRLQTGRDPGERAPILTPLEVRRLARGAAALETAVAQARAALLRRGADGEGTHETDAAPPAPAPGLAEVRAELARRLAAADRAGGHAGAPAGAPGPAPGALPA